MISYTAKERETMLSFLNNNIKEWSDNELESIRNKIKNYFRTFELKTRQTLCSSNKVCKNILKLYKK